MTGESLGKLGMRCDSCAAAILAVGNPVLWWGGAIALLALGWGMVKRDWRAWAIFAGYLAGYVPWFAYSNRTIFTFYTVAFVPFVALALTYAIGRAIGPPGAPLARRQGGVWVGAAVLIAALLFGAYFWPIWSSKWVPHGFWQAHMFLSTWI